jgi:hypothetical protein
MLPLVFAAPGVSADSPRDELREARNLFIYQDYLRATEQLRALLYPVVRLSAQEDVLAAREFLGASLWYLGKRDEATEQFTLMLVLEPTHSLDPFQHVPEMVEFVDALREKLVAEGAIAPKDPALPPTETPPKTLRVRKETVHHQPFVTAFVPFGVGQYTNGDTGLGTVFLVSEVVTLSAAIASYFLILDTRVDDPERARQFTTAFWVSQGAFLGLVAGGIVEAVVSYRGTVTETEELELPAGDSSAPSGQTLLPVVSTDGTTLQFGLQGTF